MVIDDAPERAWLGPQRGLPLTEHQLDVFLAVLRHADATDAARALGLSVYTVKNILAVLYARIGARNRAHAAWLLFPVVGDRMVA